MSKILAVNAGSSSLKFQLLEMPEALVIADGIVERIGLDDGIFTIKYNGNKDKVVLDIPNHSVAAELVLNALIEKEIVVSLDEIIGAGHRVVHGGEYFKESTLATEDAIAKVEELQDLAPLHNPANLIGYHAFKKALPEATHIFTFDTAFHQTMTSEVYTYALPYEYYTDLSVRRYGMHGISHEFVSQRAIELLGKEGQASKVITLHLGNGASITAVKDGKCINTSMGMTPLAGVMMGTRTGDIDPAIITYLMRKLDKSAEEIVDIYNKKSGMLGVSGISSDARDIENAIADGNERAILTRAIYAQRILEVVGSYVMHLGGVDALVFTAGLGENDDGVRGAVLDLLKEGLKLDYDKDLNAKIHGKEAVLSTDDSAVKIYVIPTNEELVIASDAFRIHNAQ